MKKITKEMCMVYIKDYYKSKPILLFFVSIVVLIVLWLLIQNIIVVAASAALLLTLIIFVIYITNKKIKHLDLCNFYLVEDVVVDFKKRHSPDRGGGSGHNYIYTFRNHGKYIIHKSTHPTIEIPLHKEKGIDHLSVKKLCMQSCEKGDMFFLLVERKQENTKIIMCFPEYYFNIATEDFDYIDSKYYCIK